MQLSQYTKTHGLKATAERLNIAPAYLWQVANGVRQSSHDLALAIERETGGLVTVAELRPAFAEALEAAGYVKAADHKKAA